MKTIELWFKRIWLVVAIITFGFAYGPMAGAYALTPTATGIPTAPAPKAKERLRQVWSREQVVYAKLDTFLNNVDQGISNVQELINRAKTRGKDTSDLQNALDSFSEAVNQAEPIYQSTAGIVTSHPGFDENGNVTDPLQAFATVKELGEKFKQIRQLLLGPGKALREALKTFHDENMATAVPKPTQIGG